jgi:hypothetical protein
MLRNGFAAQQEGRGAPLLKEPLSGHEEYEGDTKDTKKITKLYNPFKKDNHCRDAGGAERIEMVKTIGR